MVAGAKFRVLISPTPPLHVPWFVGHVFTSETAMLCPFPATPVLTPALRGAS
jgi:hypothetical protein